MKITPFNCCLVLIQLKYVYSFTAQNNNITVHLYSRRMTNSVCVNTPVWSYRGRRWCWWPGGCLLKWRAPGIPESRTDPVTPSEKKWWWSSSSETNDWCCSTKQKTGWWIYKTKHDWNYQEKQTFWKQSKYSMKKVQMYGE